eukprot:1982215-Prymnesium_polylepis.1
MQLARELADAATVACAASVDDLAAVGHSHDSTGDEHEAAVSFACRARVDHRTAVGQGGLPSPNDDRTTYGSGRIRDGGAVGDGESAS